MTRADKRRRKLRAHRIAVGRPGAAQDPPGGLPAFAPTPERLRRGEIGIQPLIGAAPPSAAKRDWTGERPAAAPRKVLLGHVRRDFASAVGRRLARFSGLQPRQIAAAERLERDWEMAALEPRMTVDLLTLGLGGDRGGSTDVRDAVLASRDRLQRARRALRGAGEEVLRIVEGIVIHEATADAAGAPAYSGKRDASVYVRALLGVGLNLLAEWYRGEADARSARQGPAGPC
jgi:hypothetical protein